MNLLRQIPVLSLVAGLLEFGPASTAEPQQVVRYISNTAAAQHDVFVVAHQDDWQLFMGDVVAKQIKGGDSVTFIYLTAGDDGRDSLYWQTRERAALQSTRLAIGVGATDPAAVRCARTMVLDHAPFKDASSPIPSPTFSGCRMGRETARASLAMAFKA